MNQSTISIWWFPQIGAPRNHAFIEGFPIINQPFWDTYQISRAPGILGFLGNIAYQGHDATFGAVYAHKGCTKKLEHHGLHGFALDQPSINGIGPIHRSEKWKQSETVGNGRKRSETVGNGRKRSET